MCTNICRWMINKLHKSSARLISKVRRKSKQRATNTEQFQIAYFNHQISRQAKEDDLTQAQLSKCFCVHGHIQRLQLTHTVFAIFIIIFICTLRFRFLFSSAFTLLLIYGGYLLSFLYWIHSCYYSLRRSEEANLKGWWQIAAAAAYTQTSTHIHACVQQKLHQTTLNNTYTIDVSVNFWPIC